MKIRPIVSRIGARYGLVAGVLAVVAYLTFYYLGLQPWRNLISFLVDIVIIGLFCFIPMREFKLEHNQGEFRFYHGMSIGFVSYLSVALVSSIFFAVFINWIEPSFMDTYKIVQLEEMKGMKEMITSRVDENPEEYFQKQLDAIASITKSQLILDVFLKKAIIGLFMTPILSLVLRTHKAQ